ncbi:hypothetical protein VTN49DRAFT_4545 [Thermomyces lanuginosus]|uniref:uncharacterized protein n=1 Tax=Thermomyces lanuginosus TaxID=5541 RepID=UPI003743590F
MSMAVHYVHRVRSSRQSPCHAPYRIRRRRKLCGSKRAHSIIIALSSRRMDIINAFEESSPEPCLGGK